MCKIFFQFFSVKSFYIFLRIATLERMKLRIRSTQNKSHEKSFNRPYRMSFTND